MLDGGGNMFLKDYYSKCGTGMPGAVNLPTGFEEVTVLVLFNNMN